MNPTIICLTPVRNEAWILDRFLKAASLWADYIIIADQMSTDGSREIAKRYSKVILIDNTSETFNEPERQKLLIKEARKIKGQRLLIALDTDEMFSPNILSSNEWKVIQSALPGTIIHFQWANFASDLKNMWYDKYFPCGFMDDGSEHTENNIIHSGRIPLPLDHTSFQAIEIKLIHFQFTNWERMESKHRWYQCYERIVYPQNRALDIFRVYHHMYSKSNKQLLLIPSRWIESYKKLNIDILEVLREEMIWFDEKVLDLLDKYGTEKFKKIAIWDVNWIEKAILFNKKTTSINKDPRGIIDKMIQYWLWKTQSIYQKKIISKLDRKIIKYFNY